MVHCFVLSLQLSVQPVDVVGLAASVPRGEVVRDGGCELPVSEVVVQGYSCLLCSLF